MKFNFLILVLLLISCTNNAKKEASPVENKRDTDSLTQEFIDGAVKLVKRDTVLVKTGEELINSIKSDRVILLEDKIYLLDSALKIKGCSNLTIKGKGNPKILVTNPKSNVSIIIKSNNLEFDNIFFGHQISHENYCQEGVIFSIQSSDMFFNNVILDGSGIVGFNLKNVHNLTFENGVIQNCVRGILAIENAQKIIFNKSIFQNNYCPEGCIFIHSDKNEIIFNNLNIIDNSSDPNSGSEEGNYFARSGGTFIMVDSCNFSNNKDFDLIGIPKDNIRNSDIGNMK